MRPGAAVLAGAALALGLGSCGRDADRSAVQATTERFYTAARSSDGALACAQLSVQARKQLVGEEGKGCDRAVGSLSLEGHRIESVDVYGISARVEFVRGDIVLLSDGRLGWRIDAAGCRRRGPGPLDCEVQA